MSIQGRSGRSRPSDPCVGSGLPPSTPDTGRQLRKPMLPIALLVGLSLTSTGVMAWGAKAFYPSSVSPVMPGPEQAQRIAVELPGFIGMLRDAHQASAYKGWKGGSAAFAGAEGLSGD